jgi:hypothetical protein
MEHSAFFKFLCHPPADAVDPDWMPTGSQKLFVFRCDLHDRAGRPQRARDHRLVTNLARVNVLRKNQVTHLQRLNRPLPGLGPNGRPLREAFDRA